MPQPRTATALLEARGAFAKNPDRARVDPVSRDPFPDEAPSELTPVEVKWWHRVRGWVPGDVLTGADQGIMIVVACLMAEYMVDRPAFPTSKLTRLTTEMGKLGLSPSDRAKLATKPEDDDGDF